jgi:tetratricopeptide (TPR) repeat protein
MVSAQLRASSDKEYTDIGYNYPDQGDTANSVVYYKKAIAITPRDDKAFFMLGEIRRNQGRPVEAEGYFKKAIELNPGNDLAYMRLGRIYCDRADRVNAGECFRKALGLRADYEWACSELAQIYMIQGDFRQAEILLREYTARNPGSGWGYKILGTLYKETGREDMAAECYKKLGELKEKDYESVTVHNYNKLKQILDKRKIKFVCVQYPLRSVEPLKEIFKDPKGIVFVDNQRVFAEAVKKDGYKEYFLDMFGGDFGHCTESGNSLLAENIADVILKEVFGKQGFPR